MPGVGIGDGVGVDPAGGVGVFVGVLVGVSVGAGVGVWVVARVAVGVGVDVLVAVGVLVLVTVIVGLGVLVIVTVGVGVLVTVTVAVRVAVLVTVTVGVAVGVFVGTGVGAEETAMREGRDSASKYNRTPSALRCPPHAVPLPLLPIRASTLSERTSPAPKLEAGNEAKGTLISFARSGLLVTPLTQGVCPEVISSPFL